MAASMWRMNGLCRSMTGVLLLCALLFSSKVMCQDDPSTQPPSGTADIGSTVFYLNEVLGATTEAQTNQAVFVTSAADPATQNSWQEHIFDNTNNPISLAETPSSQPVQPDVFLSPHIRCVGNGVIPEQSAVKIKLTETKECEEIIKIVKEDLTQLCKSEKCLLSIYQEGSMVWMSINNDEMPSLVEKLRSGTLKDKLGVEEVPPSSASSSSVFVGILVTGLLAALGLIVGYFKCQRRPDTKGAKLAEEGYPVDQENQGNTLASEAPLNPPPETQEKPSINGESPEAVKIETSPPTNGHSTAKTADTEL